MSPKKVGRPLSTEPKNIRLEIRLTQNQAERIEKFNEAKQEYYQIIKDLPDLTGSENRLFGQLILEKKLLRV